MSLLWTLDSSDPSKLFADTAKTTPITDGGGVAAVVPAGGTITTDALQSTSGSRPTYRANYSGSGYPAIEFDGTADNLAIAHSSDWNVSVLDLLVVLTATSSTGARGVINKFATVGWNDAWGLAVESGRFYCGSPGYSTVSGPYIGGTRILIYCHFENGKNGAQFGPVYAGTNTGTGPQNTTASVRIGRGDPTGAFYFAGAINEIKIFGGGMTEQEVMDSKNTIRAKWGLAHITSRPSHPMKSQVIG